MSYRRNTVVVFVLSLIGLEQPQLNLLCRKQENSDTPNLSLKCILDYTKSSLQLSIIISYVIPQYISYASTFFFFPLSVQSISEHQRTDFCISLGEIFTAGCAPRGAWRCAGGWGGSGGCSNTHHALCSSKLCLQKCFQAFLERKVMRTLQSRSREQAACVAGI